MNGIRKLLIGAVCLSVCIATTCQAAKWQGKQMELPPLYRAIPHGGANCFDQLADGRLVYGNNARLYVQNTLGGSQFTQITNCPDVDPSFILAYTRENGDYLLMGEGGYGTSIVYASTTAYTGGQNIPFTATTPEINNYAAAINDSRVYIAGCNDNGKNGVSAAEINESFPQLIVSNVSTYSAGIATDRSGNLYVADNDDRKIYRFTKAQLDGAFAVSNILDISDGTFFCQLDTCGTIAVDEYGCLWAAGWQANGIQVYNPNLKSAFSYIPWETNTNYKVDTYALNGASYVSFIAQNGWVTGADVVYGYDVASRYARDPNRNFHTGLNSTCDIVVYHAESGTWLILHPDQSTETIQWGYSSAYPVPADYDGDGITDAAVYVFDTGTWIIRKSSAPQTACTITCGWDQALPVPDDYDGDGLADIAVYYPPEGAWIIRSSMTGEQTVQNFGWSQARPVPADYDGDGRTDIAVYYGAEGMWMILESSSGTQKTYNWGWQKALPVPGDYDGDGIVDIAVYSYTDSAWIIRKSSSPETPYSVNWGWREAWPVPADYDGDGIVDIAVYGISDGAWIICKSSDPGTPEVANWGYDEVMPASSANALYLVY